mmetsp:Transcript_102709/g.197154  ORF Transcript_102709/g.197154 Transcript_102709/m.197154 type:complete len:192 (-) Transcript_102709:203-778(-)
MRAALFVLNCLACAGHARRVQTVVSLSPSDDSPAALNTTSNSSSFAEAPTPTEIEMPKRSSVAEVPTPTELEMPKGTDLPQKSKIVICLITLCHLGCCGVDRCYMGNTLLGVIKGLTAGGLGIWALIDWGVLVLNMVEKSKTIDMLGFEAQWEPGGIEPAFIFGICCVVLTLMKGCGLCRQARKKMQPDDA